MPKKGCPLCVKTPALPLALVCTRAPRTRTATRTPVSPRPRPRRSPVSPSRLTVGTLGVGRRTELGPHDTDHRHRRPRAAAGAHRSQSRVRGVRRDGKRVRPATCVQRGRYRPDKPIGPSREIVLPCPTRYQTAYYKTTHPDLGLIAPGFFWRTWRYEPGVRRRPLIPRKAAQLVCRGPLNKGGANVGETRRQSARILNRTGRSP